MNNSLVEGLSLENHQELWQIVSQTEALCKEINHHLDKIALQAKIQMSQDEAIPWDDTIAP